MKEAERRESTDRRKASVLNRTFPDLDEGADGGVIRKTSIDLRLVRVMQNYITWVPPTPGGS